MPVLKNDKITDQEIRCEIKKIVARNKEHEKRMEGGSSKVSVKAVGAQAKESSENAAVLAAVHEISAQVKELSTTQANEINTLKKQVEVLTKKMASDDGGGGGRKGGFGGGGKIPRNLLNTCSNCEAANTGIRCQHCTICGKTGHKRINCPENK